MLEYITAACSVCLLFRASAKDHSKKWITHASLQLDPLHSFSFSHPTSPSPSHTYISILFFQDRRSSHPPPLSSSPLSLSTNLCPECFTSCTSHFSVFFLPPSLFSFAFLSCPFLSSPLVLLPSIFTLLLPFSLGLLLLFPLSYIPLPPAAFLFTSFDCTSHTSTPSLHPLSLSSPASLHSPLLFLLLPISLSQDTNLTHGLLISESNTQTYSRCRAHKSAHRGLEAHMQ